MTKEDPSWNQKLALGQEVASRLSDGQVIGVGTGTTVAAALTVIDEKIKNNNWRVNVVPTSYQSAWQCQEIGLNVLYPGYLGTLDWAFDGADEVDPELRLLKGRGGAMLQEKLVAVRAKKFLVLVDESKLVNNLGEKFAVPVELLPDARSAVTTSLQVLGAQEITLRQGQALGRQGPYFTQSGNIVLDAQFSKIENSLDQQINSISGVVAHGLFIGLTDEVLVAGANGIQTILPSS